MPVTHGVAGSSPVRTAKQSRRVIDDYAATFFIPPTKERNLLPDGHFRKKQAANFKLTACFGDPPGARTQDPNIKSVVLYQLS